MPLQCDNNPRVFHLQPFPRLRGILPITFTLPAPMSTYCASVVLHCTPSSSIYWKSGERGICHWISGKHITLILGSFLWSFIIFLKSQDILPSHLAWSDTPRVILSQFERRRQHHRRSHSGLKLLTQICGKRMATIFFPILIG